MSKVTQCDICKGVTPNINPRYSRRKRWGWFRYDYDSQGGSQMLQDICETCWNNLKNWKQIKGD